MPGKIHSVGIHRYPQHLNWRKKATSRAAMPMKKLIAKPIQMTATGRRLPPSPAAGEGAAAALRSSVMHRFAVAQRACLFPAEHLCPISGKRREVHADGCKQHLVGTVD